MIPIVGQTEEQKNLRYDSQERTINCNTCGQGQKVVLAVRNDGTCCKCRNPMCVFCGCTETNGCLHPDFPAGEYICSWHATGVCNFCHYRITEEAYLVATGRGAIVYARYAEPDIIPVS